MQDSPDAVNAYSLFEKVFDKIMEETDSTYRFMKMKDILNSLIREIFQQCFGRIREKDYWFHSPEQGLRPMEVFNKMDLLRLKLSKQREASDVSAFENFVEICQLLRCFDIPTTSPPRTIYFGEIKVQNIGLSDACLDNVSFTKIFG